MTPFRDGPQGRAGDVNRRSPPGPPGRRETGWGRPHQPAVRHDRHTRHRPPIASPKTRPRTAPRIGSPPRPADAPGMTLLTRTVAVQHRLGHAIGHVVHDAVDFALHHPFHVLHHQHPSHHAAVVHRHDGATMDDLEGRTMMSATTLAAAAVAPVLHKAKVVAVVKHVTTTPTATATTTGPVAVADPAATKSSFVYRSFAADPLFGPKGPTITDVSQGELGDCYLLSVLSSVAKTDAALIRQIVVPNANGTFTVTFGGKKGTAVTVDADLPSLPDGRPAYAQLGAGNSLWVAVVEKAYADYVNPKADSYVTISGGWMGDAFSALGLKSTSTFAASSSTALATLVQKDLTVGDFVTVGTVSNPGAKSPLVGGHAYEIDSVTLDAKGNVTALTFRNPWGNNVAAGGYVTVTAAQAFAAFAGLSVSHA